MSLDDLPLRPELVGEQPYGAPQLDVEVCLNVNENPFPPDAAVVDDMVKAIRRLAEQVNRYPDREATALRTALANYLGFGLGADNIWAANGSNEVMTHLLQAFGGPGRTLLTFTPTYSMYPEYARNTHTRYVSAERDDNYRLDSARIMAAIEEYQPDIVLITTPNNPTGTLTPVAVIDEVCSRTDAIVIVDEAYQEFTESPEDSALALLPKYPRLVVTRTLSKAFAFAGGRLGYLAANTAVVDACRIVRLPYHLSAQTQALAEVAIKHAPSMLAKVDLLRRELIDLIDWLTHAGVQVIPSEANFCLFGRFADRHAVWQRLLDAGILVRETGPEGYLRVSAGTPADNQKFRTALAQILTEPVAARLSMTTTEEQ